MRDRRRKGVSYKKRVADINAVFDQQAKLGLSNREIWRRYIYPRWGICERAMYKILRASADPMNSIPDDQLSLFDLTRNESDNKEDTERYQSGALQ